MKSETVLSTSQLKDFIRLLAEDEKNWNLLDTEDLQSLIETVIKIYAFKSEQNQLKNDNQEPLLPLSQQNKLAETDLIVLVNQLLECKNLEIFELQMYKSFCN